MRKPDCSQNASNTCFDWLSSKGSTCVHMQTQVQVSDWWIPISHNKCLNISKSIVMWPIVITRHASFVIVHQQCICISFTSWINLLTKHTCWQNTPFYTSWINPLTKHTFLHKLDKPADKTHLLTKHTLFTQLFTDLFYQCHCHGGDHCSFEEKFKFKKKC